MYSMARQCKACRLTDMPMVFHTRYRVLFLKTLFAVSDKKVCTDMAAVFHSQY